MSTDYLGFIAGFLTTAGFVPQLIKSYRSKHVEDVSLFQPVVLLAGMVLWLTYGIIKNDRTIIAANIASMAFNVSLIVLKIRYRKSS